jgi:hypothetical protein
MKQNGGKGCEFRLISLSFGNVATAGPGLEYAGRDAGHANPYCDGRFFTGGESTMALLKFTQDAEEPELWAVENVMFAVGRPPIHVMVQTDGEIPSRECQKAVLGLLDILEDKVLDAADFLLEHYSREECEKQGIDKSRLPRSESPEAMAEIAVLRALWLFDETCEDFELWFTVPWDHDHTYDVEFENGEAVGCTVND